MECSSVDLSNNGLTSLRGLQLELLPTSLVFELDISRNALTNLDLPCAWPSLTTLLATNNQLVTVEPSLAQVTTLTCLNLTHNALDLGPWVHVLRQLPGLKELHLVGNPICHLPGYRQLVTSLLPQLCVLDSQPVNPSASEPGLAAAISSHEKAHTQPLQQLSSPAGTGNRSQAITRVPQWSPTCTVNTGDDRVRSETGGWGHHKQANNSASSSPAAQSARLEEIAVLQRQIAAGLPSMQQELHAQMRASQEWRRAAASLPVVGRSETWTATNASTTHHTASTLGCGILSLQPVLQSMHHTQDSAHEMLFHASAKQQQFLAAQQHPVVAAQQQNSMAVQQQYSMAVQQQLQGTHQRLQDAQQQLQAVTQERDALLARVIEWEQQLRQQQAVLASIPCSNRHKHSDGDAAGEQMTERYFMKDSNAQGRDLACTLPSAGKQQQQQQQQCSQDLCGRSQAKDASQQQTGRHMGRHPPARLCARDSVIELLSDSRRDGASVKAADANVQVELLQQLPDLMLGDGKEAGSLDHQPAATLQQQLEEAHHTIQELQRNNAAGVTQLKAAQQAVEQEQSHSACLAQQVKDQQHGMQVLQQELDAQQQHVQQLEQALQRQQLQAQQVIQQHLSEFQGVLMQRLAQLGAAVDVASTRLTRAEATCQHVSARLVQEPLQQDVALPLQSSVASSNQIEPLSTESGGHQQTAAADGLTVRAQQLDDAIYAIPQSPHNDAAARGGHVLTLQVELTQLKQDQGRLLQLLTSHLERQGPNSWPGTTSSAHQDTEDLQVQSWLQPLLAEQTTALLAIANAAEERADIATSAMQQRFEQLHSKVRQLVVALHASNDRAARADSALNAKTSELSQVQAQLQVLQQQLDDSQEAVLEARFEESQSWREVAKQQLREVEEQWEKKLTQEQHKTADAERQAAKALVLSRQMEKQVSRLREASVQQEAAAVSELQVKLDASTEALRLCRRERNALLAVLRKHGITYQLGLGPVPPPDPDQ